MRANKRIALVAHDQRKQDLLTWVLSNVHKLKGHDVYATGTTGKLIGDNTPLEVTCLKSGPLGGDQQLGAMIANNDLDILIFFWDPMTAQPHDVDVKALLRMSVLYQVAVACNRTTADFIVSSRWFGAAYDPQLKDYGALIS